MHYYHPLKDASWDAWLRRNDDYAYYTPPDVSGWGINDLRYREAVSTIEELRAIDPVNLEHKTFCYVEEDESAWLWNQHLFCWEEFAHQRSPGDRARRVTSSVYISPYAMVEVENTGQTAVKIQIPDEVLPFEEI